MIESFADHARKKEEKNNYDQLVGFFHENITQTSTWKLMFSITYNVQQTTFSSRDAKKMVKILCSEFGIRSSEIQYLKAFSSAPVLPEKTKPSNIIKITSQDACHKTNNERIIYDLCSAIQDKNIEYRQALDLVIQIIENHPDSIKYLQS